MPKYLVTGGAGFVGSTIALALKKHFTESEVIALDNLHRAGSELNVSRLKAGGVDFVRGDVREPDDLASIGQVDFVIECAAEPSVLAGCNGSPTYVLETNLQGAVNCAEVCRRHNAGMLFLSTSRVYPFDRLSGIQYSESDTRFRLDTEQELPGVTVEGISEDFDLRGLHSFYGTAKLSAEMVLREYQHAYGFPVIINRCGVIAGPGQFGRIDQGILTFWLASHMKKRPLRYIGFGGSGKQVRDALHVDDLIELVIRQLKSPDQFSGMTYNVGGGMNNSMSLLELTEVCSRLCGNRVPVTSDPETRYADIPIYVTDNRCISEASGWFPGQNVEKILAETYAWLSQAPAELIEVL